MVGLSNSYVQSERAQTTVAQNHNKTITDELPLPSLMINKHRASPSVRTAAIGARPKMREAFSSVGRKSEISTAFDNEFMMPGGL